MAKNQIKLVSLTHTELAMLYFNDYEKAKASRKLSNWIKNDPHLLARLRAAGYKRHHHSYTPRQQKIIYEHLGYPSPVEE